MKQPKQRTVSIQYQSKVISTSTKYINHLPTTAQVVFVGSFEGMRWSLTRHLHLNGDHYTGKSLYDSATVVTYPIGTIAQTFTTHVANATIVERKAA